MLGYIVLILCVLSTSASRNDAVGASDAGSHPFWEDAVQIDLWIISPSYTDTILPPGAMIVVSLPDPVACNEPLHAKKEYPQRDLASFVFAHLNPYIDSRDILRVEEGMGRIPSFLLQSSDVSVSILRDLVAPQDEVREGCQLFGWNKHLSANKSQIAPRDLELKARQLVTLLAGHQNHTGSVHLSCSAPSWQCVMTILSAENENESESESGKQKLHVDLILQGLTRKFIFPPGIHLIFFSGDTYCDPDVWASTNNNAATSSSSSSSSSSTMQLREGGGYFYDSVNVEKPAETVAASPLVALVHCVERGGDNSYNSEHCAWAWHLRYQPPSLEGHWALVPTPTVKSMDAATRRIVANDLPVLGILQQPVGDLHQSSTVLWGTLFVSCLGSLWLLWTTLR